MSNNKKYQDETSVRPFKPEWITDGINREMDEFAQEFAKELQKGRLTTSQIRNIFGEIKNLQMKILNDDDFEKHKGQFILSKAKMAYAAARHSSKEKNGISMFKEKFDLAHKEVKDKQTFENFVSFITAILAYHKASDVK